MGTVRDLYIIADPSVHRGVHMVNEVGKSLGSRVQVSGLGLGFRVQSLEFRV